MRPLSTFRLIFPALLLTLSSPSAAQRTCGSMEHLRDQLAQDPSLAQRLQAVQANYLAVLASGGGASAQDTLIRIPVVVHVLWNASEENISDAQIVSQIGVLNEDFRRFNVDAPNTPAQWQGIAADTEFEFCLAARDPGGFATNGITRTYTSVTQWQQNDAMKYAAFGGHDAWPPGQYLNIWVCNLASVLGYAQFPGLPPATDGVVIRTSAFGEVGPVATPYHLGRTATHEVGHWLDLRHIWGDAQPNCGDDAVGDTPPANGPHYGCLTGIASCGGTNMIENYMDYSDDPCMNLFTQGQKIRMRAIFTPVGTRAALLASPALTGAAPCAVGSIGLVQTTPATALDPWSRFRITPAAGVWNAVAVSSPSDWDLFLGTAQSVFGAPYADFAVCDGTAGTIPLTRGILQRYSGSNGATVEHRGAVVMNIGQQATRSLLPGHVIDLLQFQVGATGSFSIQLSGTAGLSWDLYSPMFGTTWRPRGALYYGTVGGPPVTAVLGPGWHCLIVIREGGPSSSGAPYAASVCAVNPLALPNGPPQTVANGCQPISVSPAAGLWNVVGVASALADWDITIGPATSNYGGIFGGGFTDFVLANGSLGAIAPVTGQVVRASGSAAGTVQHRSATTMSVGAPRIGALGAGEVLSPLQLQVPSAGSYDITTSGTANLSWGIFAPGPGPQWTTLGAALLTGHVGDATLQLNLGPGLHAFVVWKDNGPATTLSSYTIDVCPHAAPLSLAGAGAAQQVLTSCIPFNLSGLAAGWNAAGVTSASDWDINIGTAVSQLGAGSCDYLAADGHSGTIAPTSGVLARYGGSDPCTLQLAPVSLATPGATGTASWSASTVLRVFEFQTPSPGTYTIATGAGSTQGLSWDLHAPGAGSGWRRRIDAASANHLLGEAPAGYPLAAGWHAIVVYRNGAAGSSGTISVSVGAAPNPVPAIASLTPAFFVTGSPGSTLTVAGSGFVAASVVEWNGAALPTTYAGATSISASVAASLLVDPGTASVRILNPAPGGGASAAVPLSIAFPIISSLTPASIAVMTAASPPVTLTVSGNFFLPTSFVRANGLPLPTTYIGPGTLQCSIGPSVPQTLKPGGISIHVENTHRGFSDGHALMVGAGSNRGLMGPYPLAPSPGEPFSLLTTGGVPGALVSLYADFGNPPPVTGWPTAASNLVLAIGPYAATPGPFVPILDGIGIHAPATGTTLNAAGNLVVPGFVQPNPQLGLTLTLQALYLDASLPAGFRMTWARYPIQL